MNWTTPRNVSSFHHHKASSTRLVCGIFSVKSGESVVNFVRLGSNGVYVGMHDFWIDSLAGHVSLHIKHAQKTSLCTRGVTQTVSLAPTVSLSLTHFHANIRCDGLYLKGERGTKVPDMKVQLLDLAVDLAMEVGRPGNDWTHFS